MKRWLALAAVLFAGCAHDAYDDAKKQDTPEAYERALREHPDDPSAEPARARLAELRFHEARQAHTVLAYKRFLEDFPSSDQAPDALKLLEGLRFAAAQDANTIAGYEEFLREHPDGAHAAQAHAALESLCWERAKKAPDAASVRAFIARFPQSAHRAEADQLADDRAFHEAQARGNPGVIDYLEDTPQGVHRDEARAMLASQQALALADGGDFVSAYALANRDQEHDRAALLTQLAQLELADVAAALQPAPLRELAKRRPEVAKQAEALASAIEHARDVKALRDQIARLDPLSMGRPPDELMHALDAPDPRDRWLAAEELGALGAQQAYDKLLDVATDSNFEELRLRAFAALQSLAAERGHSATAVIARQVLEKLRKMADGPRMYLKIALLEDLAGMNTQARADYAKCLRGDTEDLLALRRLLELTPPSFDRAVYARRLAVTLSEQAPSHATEEGDPPMLASRWFCGAYDDAQAAKASLDALPDKIVKDAPDDISTFREKARAALSMSKARLDDREDSARAEQPRFVSCGVDDVAPRMRDGVKTRLDAVERLARSESPLAEWPLRRAAQRDPSAEVRQAAFAALHRQSALGVK